MSIADKIKNKNLTVREAIENAGVTLATDKGAPTVLVKNIEAAGLSLDSPWDDIKSNEFLIKLNEVGSEANFTTLTTVENRLKEVANVGDVPYPYTTVFGAGSKSRKIKVDGKPLEKAAQARRKAKPIGVPEAKRAIPAFVQGINAIPDDQVRAAVAFNMLVPLRPIEVSNIGIDDIDFETGKFKEAWRRGNKIRNDIELPEVALELLRDARDAAIAKNQEKIFDVDTVKLTKATKIPGGIADQFKKFESIMGRPFKGSSDIRKIVPSLMVGELQAGIEVSTIMGHASTDEMMGSIKKMTASSYISPIITSEGSAAKQALRGYHNMIAEILELTSLNELPSTIGFSANALTKKDAPKFAVAPKNSDIIPSPDKQTIGTITDSDLGLFEDIKAERSAQLQLSATQAEKKRLELEADMPQLSEEAIRQREEAKLREAKIRADVKTGKDADAGNELRKKIRNRFTTLGLATAGVLGATPGPLGDLVALSIESALADKRDEPDRFDVAEERGRKGFADLFGIKREPGEKSLATSPGALVGTAAELFGVGLPPKVPTDIARMRARQPDAPAATPPTVPSLAPPPMNINIPDPVQTNQGMLSAGGAKDRVNQARSAALAGEETTLRGSFLN